MIHVLYCVQASVEQVKKDCLQAQSGQATVLAIPADLVELVEGLEPLYVVQLMILLLHCPRTVHCQLRHVLYQTQMITSAVKAFLKRRGILNTESPKLTLHFDGRCKIQAWRLLHLRIIGLQVDSLLLQPRVRCCSEVVPPV